MFELNIFLRNDTPFYLELQKIEWFGICVCLYQILLRLMWSSIWTRTIQVVLRKIRKRNSCASVNFPKRRLEVFHDPAKRLLLKHPTIWLWTPINKMDVIRTKKNLNFAAGPYLWSWSLASNTIGEYYIFFRLAAACEVLEEMMWS